MSLHSSRDLGLTGGKQKNEDKTDEHWAASRGQVVKVEQRNRFIAYS